MGNRWCTRTRSRPERPRKGDNSFTGAYLRGISRRMRGRRPEITDHAIAANLIRARSYASQQHQSFGVGYRVTLGGLRVASYWRAPEDVLGQLMFRERVEQINHTRQVDAGRARRQAKADF